MKYITFSKKKRQSNFSTVRFMDTLRHMGYFDDVAKNVSKIADEVPVPVVEEAIPTVDLISKLNTTGFKGLKVPYNKELEGMFGLYGDKYSGLFESSLSKIGDRRIKKVTKQAKVGSPVKPVATPPKPVAPIAITGQGKDILLGRYKKKKKDVPLVSMDELQSIQRTIGPDIGAVKGIDYVPSSNIDNVIGSFRETGSSIDDVLTKKTFDRGNVVKGVNSFDVNSPIIGKDVGIGGISDNVVKSDLVEIKKNGKIFNKKINSPVVIPADVSNKLDINIVKKDIETLFKGQSDKLRVSKTTPVKKADDATKVVIDSKKVKNNLKKLLNNNKDFILYNKQHEDALTTIGESARIVSKEASKNKNKDRRKKIK